MFKILWAFIAGLLKRRFASHVESQENPWTIQTRSNTGQYCLVFRTEWDMIYLSIFGADRTKTQIFCWKVTLPVNSFSTRIPVYCDPHFCQNVDYNVTRQPTFNQCVSLLCA